MVDPDRSSPAERLEQLVAAGTLLTTELSLDGVLQQVAQLGAGIIGARYAAIGVLAPDGRTLESFTTYGLTAGQRAALGALPRGHGILGLVIREGRVVRLPDLTRHPDSYGFPPNHPPMHSFLGVPVVGRRGTLGDLYFTEKIGAAEFDDVDERIALLLAAQTAAAIENAGLHEESARLLEEVQQLQRTRERFFAMVNHELRNALAAVFGWSEMLVRKKDPATVPRAAFEVLDSAQHAVSLINDLLDLSRLDEDRLKVVIRPVDLAAVGRSAVARVTPLAVPKQVRLTFQADADISPSATDATRVEQILVNLLGNAIRHAPEGGHVGVRIARAAEPNRLVVQVDDDGPGVSADDQDLIFDVYVTRAGEESQGVGLGLPLSRRLARLLGGELTAATRAAGGGRFLLELPVADS